MYARAFLGRRDGGIRVVVGVEIGAFGAAAAFPTLQIVDNLPDPGYRRGLPARCLALCFIVNRAPSVTTPLSVCTESCFMERPESRLNLP